MSARLFLSQEILERAEARGAAALADGALVVRGGALDGARVALEPAARVRAVSDGSVDEHALTGKVRPVAALIALGGEVLGSSMLLGDAAFDVEPGFLAVVEPDVAARLLPPPAPAEQATDGSPLQGQSDAESLARFLLNRLP